MSVNSRLNTTKIIGQRKAFYRQRIPGSGCAKKQLDPGIGDRKIMQSI